MKMYWGRVQKGAISRDTALGCMATNVAAPGFGTLLAGHTATGLVQAILGLGGMALTLFYGVRAIAWSLSNWGRLNDPYGDPFETLSELWLVMRLPLLGIFCFGFAWVWAFLSSMIILRRTPKNAQTRVPPTL
jgi:hypothetical protein